MVGGMPGQPTSQGLGGKMMDQLLPISVVERFYGPILEGKAQEIARIRR